MATRAAVELFDYDDKIVLYQHWDGYGLFDTVVAAARRAKVAGRLSDTPYFARMIFCEMVQNDLMGSTGFGIMTEVPLDVAYVVTVDERTITERHVPSRVDTRSITFEELTE